ncbi:hypothetical protein ACP70R_018271 [Stipagrostis hirtigluma subsp. patula]
MMYRLTAQATGSLRLFVNRSEGHTDLPGVSQMIYGLAQCTRDLSDNECTRCLTKFVPELSNMHPNNTLGDVNGGNCYVHCQIGEAFDIGTSYMPSDRTEVQH